VALEARFFETLCSWSLRNGDRPALLVPGGRPPLSWSRLPEVLAGLADAVLATGAEERSRIVIALPPGAEAVTVFLAAMRVGIAVPLNPELTATEFAEALARLRPHLVVFCRGLPGAVERAAVAQGILTLEVEWTLDDAAGAPRIVSGFEAHPLSGGDALAAPRGTRLILQTSGTTACPKLVPLTVENLEASAGALIRSLSLTENDRALNLLPQFHIGGLWDLVAGPLLTGGSVICGGTFSGMSFEAGCRLDPTWVQLVPAMLRSVLERPLARPPGLRFIRSVSAALPSSLKSEAEARLCIPIVEIYGMTETAGVITSNPLEPARQRPASVGRCVGLEVTIRDGSGQALPAGQEGEVFILGVQLSPGYIDADREDAAAFTPHGFRTGDIGRFDAEGDLWLVGRSKDLINRGGEMISPSEVEAALIGLPGVLDAAVCGLPHPTLGETVAAAIVFADQRRAQSDPTAEVQAALRPTLGHARLPSRVHAVQEIPRSVGGKIQRRVLASRFADLDDHVAAASPTRYAGRQEWPDALLPRWVAEIWAPILGLASMGADEDFFSAGGSSLKAAQAAAVIQDRFPGEIVYVSSVYEAPTPVLQAAFLEKNHPTVVARVLGQALQSQFAGVEPVNSSMRRRFLAAVVDPLPDPPAPAQRNPRAIFIVGAPRSGSTLLRAMLAGHPRLFAPPELYLLSHPDLASRHAWYAPHHTSQLEGLPRALMAAKGVPAAQAVEEITGLQARSMSVPETYRILQTAIGNRILVDKTPFYGVHRNVLEAAAGIFDDAFFIHLSRHPYGMIRSFEEARLAQLWWPRLAGPRAQACPFHPRQLAELIWAEIHGTVREFLSSRPATCQHHIRYEELVDAPEAVCRGLVGALDLEFHQAMLEPLGDPVSRMTDGLHPGARMIGDPKFHAHRSIEKGAADRWRFEYEQDFLSDETWTLAQGLGHTARIAGGCEWEIFDL